MIPIEMVAQPIVDLTNRKVVMEEWLCRPKEGTVKSFFDLRNPKELWMREALCIKSAIKKKSTVKKSLNLSLSSMPYFLQTDWTWYGIIEIVEWGIVQLEKFQDYSILLKQRGLEVWLDDLTYQSWAQWRHADVNGYKITFEEAIHHPEWIEKVKQQGKYIIVEQIETREMEKQVMGMGITLGQGFLYEDPKNIKTIAEYS